jgi:hypothetical protein
MTQQIIDTIGRRRSASAPPARMAASRSVSRIPSGCQTPPLTCLVVFWSAA